MKLPVIAFAVFALAAPAARAEDMRVTVIAILASDRHQDVPAKLKGIAEEVRKADATLTGYRLERTSSEPVSINQKKSFSLVADVAAEVTVLTKEDKDKKIRVTIKAPHMGEITYTTVADKYFPVLTRYQTDKDKERLIFAVMVKPITEAAPAEKSK